MNPRLYKTHVVSIFAVVFFINWCEIASLNSFPYEVFSNCNDDEYYNLAQLECLPCEAEFSVPSENGLSCRCPSGYRRNKDDPLTLTCIPCPSGQVTTSDGFQCITCTDLSVSEDECMQCAGHEIPVEYNPNGTLMPQKTCIACEGVSQPTGVENPVCSRCDPFVIAAVPDQCECTTGFQTGGICFSSDLEITTTFAVNNLDGTTFQSLFINQNYAGAVQVCQSEGNVNLTSCQLWGNTCVMHMYDSSVANSPCSKFQTVAESATVHGIQDWKKNMPWLFYSDQGEDIITDVAIDTVLSADPNADNNKLDVMAAIYKPNGTFVGLDTVVGGLIQLCQDTPQRMNAAFDYGQNFKSSCAINAQDFWDKYETAYFDFYLKYSDVTNTDQLFPIPLLVTNYKQGGKDNSGATPNDWQLTRRFFLVDNLVGKVIDDGFSEVVRYAQSIVLKVELQNEGNQPNEGKIYPPLLSVTYAELKYPDDYTPDKQVEVSFEVVYSLDQGSSQGSMTLAAIILSVPALLYAALKTTAWRRRAGRLTVDVPAFVKFFAFASGLLADMLFVIVYITSVYLLIFYKRQSTVKLLLPTPDQEALFVIFIIAAFVLKALDLIHLIFTQCTVDIFFVDWERPQGQKTQPTKGSEVKTTANPVSIWRTYFVANEWNEIQTCRRSSPLFQICSVLFFLKVVGFENICTYDLFSSTNPDESEYISEDSKVLRFAMATTLYLVIGSFQWIFFTFIYERFVENNLQNFVDLCSMANVSIFVLANKKYGYYIHGRSVHGFADTDMKRMREQLKREEDNLCGQRGLLPNSEEQTFEMQLPDRMREQYDRILLPLTNAQGRIDTRGRPGAGGDSKRLTEAYVAMNKFLSAFIDHGLRDIDYQVKDKLLLERILDMEFSDSADQGFLYNEDGHSFDRVLYAGNELTLVLFEVLLFCFVDIISSDFVLAAIITFLLMRFFKSVRDSFGRNNLAKKTLVDERFLI